MTEPTTPPEVIHHRSSNSRGASALPLTHAGVEATAAHAAGKVKSSGRWGAVRGGIRTGAKGLLGLTALTVAVPLLGMLAGSLSGSRQAPPARDELDDLPPVPAARSYLPMEDGPADGHGPVEWRNRVNMARGLAPQQDIGPVNPTMNVTDNVQDMGSMPVPHR